MKDHIRPSTRPARNSRDAVHSWKMPGLRRLPDESWEQRECGKMTMTSNQVSCVGVVACLDVRWGQTMEGFECQQKNFELNSVINWKPMKVMQNRCYVV